MNHKTPTLPTDIVLDIVHEVVGSDPRKHEYRGRERAGESRPPMHERARSWGAWALRETNHAHAAIHAALGIHHNGHSHILIKGVDDHILEAPMAARAQAIRSRILQLIPDEPSAVGGVSINQPDRPGHLWLRADAKGISAAIGIPSKSVTDGLTQGFRRLRKGLQEIGVTLDQPESARAFHRAFTIRCLATRISDIAEAAGQDPLHVAEVFVAELKKERQAAVTPPSSPVPAPVSEGYFKSRDELIGALKYPDGWFDEAPERPVAQFRARGRRTQNRANTTQ